MSRKSLNHWPPALAVAILLTAIPSALLAQQAAESADAAQQMSQDIKEKVSTGLDPEGLNTTPSAVVPPPITTENQPDAETLTGTAATDEGDQTEQTERAQQLVPRVANRETNDSEVTWDSNENSEEPQPTAAAAVELAVDDIPGYQNEYAMPKLRITSLAPEQANIHRSSQFRFLVTNDGPVPAEAVSLIIGINGQGRIISTFPQGAVEQANVIYFTVGNLAAGEKREFGFEYQAVAPGQISVTPRVTCSATTQFAVDATAPQVDIQFEGFDQFVVGQQINQRVTIRNLSTEIIRNVALQHVCTPSSAFENIAFETELNRYTIESLSPGQAHDVILTATAVQPGPAKIEIVVDGDNIRGSSNKSLLVTQSQLAAEMQGPELTYLNSMGTYSITVTNDQPRPVDNIKVRLDIPLGMIVKVIDRKAEFDAATSSITWTIPSLGAAQSETIPFKAIISTTGQHLIRTTIENVNGMMTHAQMTTQAVGRADIDLKVITNPEPIEIGSTTSIIVQVQNRGTHMATDVQIELILPDALTGIESADYAMNGQHVSFNAFQLGPGQTHNLTVPVTSDKSGDHIIRATVKSSASSTTIGAENSLFFFSSTTKRTAQRDER